MVIRHLSLERAVFEIIVNTCYNRVIYPLKSGKKDSNMHLKQIHVHHDGREDMPGSLQYFLHKKSTFWNTEVLSTSWPKAGIEELCNNVDDLITQNPLPVYYLSAGIFDVISYSPNSKTHSFMTIDEDDVCDQIMEKIVLS